MGRLPSRDADGSPTGTLQEGAAYDVMRTVVGQPPWPSGRRTSSGRQQELLRWASRGGAGRLGRARLLRAYRELDDEGALTARVVASRWDRNAGMEQVDRLVEQREWAPRSAPRNTIKIMLDGCLEAHRSSMFEPYEGDFGRLHDRGIQFVEAEALNEAVVALALGFQVHQHALGDRAFREGLDAIEAARKADG